MKRLLVLALLISLGLNLGLAWRLHQASAPRERPVRPFGSRMSPAVGDTQAWRERMDRRFAHLVQNLNLDEDQQAAFARHRRQVESDVRAKAAVLEASREARRAEAERRPPDPAAVTAALAAVGRAEAVLDSLVAVNLRTELELLDPEQQSQLLRMLPFERLGAGGGYGHGGRGEGRAGRGHRHGDAARPDEGPDEGPAGQ